MVHPVVCVAALLSCTLNLHGLSDRRCKTIADTLRRLLFGLVLVPVEA